MRQNEYRRTTGRLWFGVVLVLLLSMAAIMGFGGCAANDPFDPDSVRNSAPSVRFFVSPVDPGDELNPSSYYQTTFRWSGTDTDGWVEEFYISVREDRDTPASWDTTTRSDTTMTFNTDDQGEAEATVLLACRDDRGAYSDTVVQYVPLRNSPPAVSFQSDYQPLRNLQRQMIYVGETVVDTLYYNYGPNSFRLFAMDPDGAATMDDFYRYTLMDTEPEITWDVDDPSADPVSGWIRVPFGSDEEIKKFQILVKDLEPGTRTLTVVVMDEAMSEARFEYSWEVRAPGSPVLYLPGNSTADMRNMITELLDTTYGVEQWDSMSFWRGMPDNGFVLLETFRMFDVLIWTDGGVTTDILKEAATNGGALQQYIQPEGTEQPGKLLFLSSALTGSASQLPHAFRQLVVGIHPTRTEPVTSIEITAGSVALGAEAHLTDMVADSGLEPKGYGLKCLATSEPLFTMEECVRCYSVRPPYDPVIGVRTPLRSSGLPASVVAFSVQMDRFEQTSVVNALRVVLEQEMEATNP